MNPKGNSQPTTGIFNAPTNQWLTALESENSLGKAISINKPSNLKLNLAALKLEILSQNPSHRQGVMSAKNSVSSPLVNSTTSFNQTKPSPKGNPPQPLTHKGPKTQSPEVSIQIRQPLGKRNSHDKIVYMENPKEKQRKYQALSKDNDLKRSDSKPHSKQSPQRGSQKQAMVTNMKSPIHRREASPSLKPKLEVVSIKPQPVQALQSMSLPTRKKSKSNEQTIANKNSSMGDLYPELQNILESMGNKRSESNSSFPRGKSINSSNINNDLSGLPAGDWDMFTPSNNAQYKEMAKVLAEKNQELDLLQREKIQLKTALESLTEELEELRKVKTGLIETNSNTKENLENSLQTFQIDRPETANESKVRASPKKKLTQDSFRVQTPELHGAALKSQGKPQGYSKLEQRTESVPNALSSEVRGPLSRKNTAQEAQKKMASPYYSNPFTTNPKRFSSPNTDSKKFELSKYLKNSFKVPQESAKPQTTNSLNFKKGELVASFKAKKDSKTKKEEQSTAQSMDLTKRKFSLGHNAVPMERNNISPDPNERQYPLSFRGEKIPKVSIENSAQKSTEKSGLDIGLALKALKERIKVTLERQNAHQNSLRQTNALILEKIEALSQ